MISDLRARLDRFPAQEKPLQRGAVLLELGAALIDADRHDEAASWLRPAPALLEGAPPEQAAALNLLGVACRSAGHIDEAAAAFRAAVDAYRALGSGPDEAAAQFNLGLALRQLGESGSAELAAARHLFDELGLRSWEAQAARELGRSLLLDGDLPAAVATLAAACEASDALGDTVGLGEANNVLGLALLADGDIEGAVSALERGRACAPPSTRPEQHATASANLALAHERAGRAAHARQMARQVLVMPGAPEAAEAQASAVMDRLGPAAPGTDLLTTLDAAPQERWASLIRDECRTLLAEPADDRRESLLPLVGRCTDDDLGESLLGVVIELPPPATDALIATIVDCLVHVSDRADVASGIARAIARFPLPQMMRLQSLFDLHASSAGLAHQW